MPSMRAHLASAFVRINKVLLYRPGTSVRFQRTAFAMTGELLIAPEGVGYEPATADGVPAAWLTPRGAETDRVILYLHGGGYVIGAIRGYRKMASRIASAAGCRALIIGYRLAPENRIPAAVDDSVRAYRWLLAQGYRSDRIVIAGDSAGGGLAVATLVTLRDSGDPLPAAAVVLSPWVDLEVSGESARTLSKKDPMINVEGLKRWAGMYLGGADPQSPLASPIYADLEGLPPMLVLVGTNEVLLDDARRLAERARQDGVEVELEAWEGMFHVWLVLCPLVPESTDAVRKVGEYCRARTG